MVQGMVIGKCFLMPTTAKTWVSLLGSKVGEAMWRGCEESKQNAGND